MLPPLPLSPPLTLLKQTNQPPLDPLSPTPRTYDHTEEAPIEVLLAPRHIARSCMDGNIIHKPLQITAGPCNASPGAGFG